MREIVSLHIGGAGVSVGEQLWPLLMKDHDIDPATSRLSVVESYSSSSSPEGGSKPITTRVDPSSDNIIETYFQEGRRSGKDIYCPRSIFADLDDSRVLGPGLYDQSPEIQNSCLALNRVANGRGAGSHWAKGHYTDGAELIDSILDVVRKEVEACDCLQGFQIYHSLAGGTGGGLGTLCLSKLREEWPDRATMNFSFLPKVFAGEAHIYPYTVILSLFQLEENSDGVVLFDNSALYDIALFEHQKREDLSSGESAATEEEEKDSSFTKKEGDGEEEFRPTFTHLNDMISSSVANLTSPFRFKQQGMSGSGTAEFNSTMNRLNTNMTPFREQHFYVPSCQTPLFPKSLQSYNAWTPTDVVWQSLEAKYLACKLTPRDGVYLGLTACFRGRASSSEVNSAFSEFHLKSSRNFSEWMPSGSQSIKTSLIEKHPPPFQQYGCTTLSNTTRVSVPLKQWLDSFNALFRRKAFLYHYCGEGMDEMEFTEAESALQDLVSGYLEHENSSSPEGGAGDDSLE